MTIHTDLKFYCCSDDFSGRDGYDHFKGRKKFPLLSLDRVSNVTQNLRYCARPFYKNTLGHWVAVDGCQKGHYAGSIEFDVAAPLLCPENFHSCWAWVDCVSQLSTLVFGQGPENSYFSLDRHPVEGSLFLHEKGKESIPVDDACYDVAQKKVHIKQVVENPFYMTYRPCLLMRIRSVEQRIKEDEGTSHWKIDLEE